MKKLLLFFILLGCSLPVFAASYYATSNGVLRTGTTVPLRSISASRMCNTYSLTYQGSTYYMVKDNEKPYTRKSLLGCEDYSATNLFDPIVSLNSDYSFGRLTPAELSKANIRFVKLTASLGPLDLYNKNNDLDLNKIAYIDLSYMYSISGNSGSINVYMDNPEVKYLKSYKIHINTKTRAFADSLLN